MNELVTRVLMVPVLAGLSVSAGIVAPDWAAPAPGVEVAHRDDMTAALIDHYEELQPFRGIDNDRLLKGADQLHLGVVAVETGVRAEPVKKDGYVDLGDIANGVRMVAASDGEGMDRYAIIIDSPGSTQHRFDVTMPEDSSVVHEASGAIIVTSGTNQTVLAPALAVDADGSEIPARYHIVGNELVVDVALEGAALPVLVDPVSSRYWWGTTTWYSRSDVRWQADWWSVGRVVKQVCNRGPIWSQFPCKQTVGRYMSWVYGTWQSAKRNNQCLSMSMTWTGQVTGIRAYNCTWG